MTIEDFEQEYPSRRTTIVRRVSRPFKAAAAGAKNLAARVPSAVNAGRRGAQKLAARMPAAVDATQAGAHATTTTLQKLSDSNLRSLAASSVGLGAGLYVSGKHRLAVAAGVVPALIVAAAIALRPAKKINKAEAKA
jgi:hypothetical protein